MHISDSGVIRDKQLFEDSKHFIQIGVGTKGGIVHLVQRLRVGSGGSQLVDLNDIVNIGEIARMATVTVNHRSLATQHLADEFRDHRSIGALGVLPAAEYIEIAQADGSKAIHPMEDLGIQLIDILGYRIG